MGWNTTDGSRPCGIATNERDIAVLPGNYTVVPPWFELIAALIRIADCMERIEAKLDKAALDAAGGK